MNSLWRVISMQKIWILRLRRIWKPVFEPEKAVCLVLSYGLQGYQERGFITWEFQIHGAPSVGETKLRIISSGSILWPNLRGHGQSPFASHTFQLPFHGKPLSWGIGYHGLLNSTLYGCLCDLKCFISYGIRSLFGLFRAPYLLAFGEAIQGFFLSFSTLPYKKSTFPAGHIS